MNIKTIEREIKMLERRKKLLQALAEKRERIENQIRSLRGGTKVKINAVATAKAIKRERELPRGVLTMALVETMGKKSMSVKEIIEEMEKKELPAEPAQIRNLLAASPRFHKVEGKRGYYKAEGLSGALFDRLQSEKSKLVTA